MTTPLERALREIADIGEGSRTANSLPHIAKIAREAIDAALSEQIERQGVPQNVLDAISDLDAALAPELDLDAGMTDSNWVTVRNYVLYAALSEQTERQGVMETETERMGRMMDQSDADKRAEIERLRKRLNYLEESPCANN